MAVFGLGLAWARPDRRVIVLDGDGALLMRMGALATIGYERPKNLVHVLLDNAAHDSTGTQSTVTHSVDLATCARACGYPSVSRIGTSSDLEKAIADRTPGLRFLHVKTKPGAPADLPRPKITPREVAQRIKEHMNTK
jgi:phosphonopyruvate decarboxylase